MRLRSSPWPTNTMNENHVLSRPIMCYCPIPARVVELTLAKERYRFRSPYLPPNGVGGGGVRTSGPDLSKITIAHMNGGQAPNVYQLLQPETVEMMYGIAVPTSSSISLITITGNGLGWTIAECGIQGRISGASGCKAKMLHKETTLGNYGIIFLRNWSWELADDYDYGFEY